MSDDRDPWFAHFVKWTVRGWRRIDARLNRPLPAGRAWLWALILPAGVAWHAPVLAVLAVLGMALGPAPRAGVAQLVLLAFGLGGIALVHLDSMRAVRLSRQGGYLPRLCAGYMLVLLAMAMVLALLAGAESHADPGLQLHVGTAIAVVIGLGLALAAWFSTRLLRIADPGALAPLLGSADLFSPRERYLTEDSTLLSIAALVALVRYPDRVLLPAAVLLLFTDEAARDLLGRGWQGELWLLGLVTGASWLLVTLGLVQERLMEVLETIGRLFFTGPQRVLTWLLIVVALLRLMQVHYVTYLFGAGSGVIVLYFVLAYVVAWFYGFWCDLLLARRLLVLLANGTGTGAGFRYRVFLHPEARDTGADGAAARAGPDSPLSSVRAHGRSLALHGAGRFKVEGVHDAAYAAQEGIADRALAFLTSQQLTTRLRALAEDQGRATSLTLIRDVQRATMIYPAFMAIMAFALLAIPGYVGVVAAIQPPALVIRPGPDGSYNLAAALEGREHPASVCKPPEPGAPRIALALSGGGTRAAMHGYAVLRGLAANGQICNVVAVSGVSGGAAALGYFALHQGRLRSARFDASAWADFAKAMTDPFIDDIIAAQSSLRVVYGRWGWRNDACAEPERPYQRVEGWYPPARTRSGTILAEDFTCTFGAGTTDQVPFAVIFNTALLGRFDTQTSACSTTTGTLPARARACRDDLDGSPVGRRLALTNLPGLAQGGDAQAAVGDWLVVLNQPGISLARSAALSSNFPPVFPDAAIDVTADGQRGQRYWVTDGGAVENRGAVTLYLALLDALSAPGVRLSGPLHVIVADASGLAGTYAESRGLRSAVASGSKLALALEAELRDRLALLSLAAGQKKLFLHELDMPKALVGAIGTHWRLPGQIVLGDARLGGEGLVGRLFQMMRVPGAAPGVRLSGAEAASLVECLYSRDGAGMPGVVPAKLVPALAIIAAGDDTWRNGAHWRQLETDLGVAHPMRGMCGGLGPEPPAQGR